MGELCLLDRGGVFLQQCGKLAKVLDGSGAVGLPAPLVHGVLALDGVRHR